MENVIKQEGAKIYPGMRKISREEILSLVHRRDRENFKFPKNFESIEWDRIPFLTWFHSSGHRAYLLETENGNPRLWTLEIDTKKEQKRKVPSMCDLCCYVGKSNEIRMFTHRIESNRNKVIGFHFCSDLKCSENVFKLSPNLRETITQDRKVERMMENLHRILLAFAES